MHIPKAKNHKILQENFKTQWETQTYK